MTIIDSQVLSIPAAEKLLLRMENKPDGENPFWPIHRLQAIVDRAKQDRDLLLWFLHAIVHMVEHQNVPATHVSSVRRRPVEEGTWPPGHPGLAGFQEGCA